MWYHPPRLRILLDYRPALRHRTGVGEYAHHLAAFLAPRLGHGESLTLFSSSWKDRLPSNAVPGAGSLDVRLPVQLMNLAWHRLGWPPVERLGAQADVVWSLHPLLMPSTRAAQFVTVHDLYFLDHPEAVQREVRRDYPALAGPHAKRAAGVIVNSEYTRELVIARLQVRPELVTVCHPGAPGWPARPEPEAVGPILHLGTIGPRKNVRAIITAYLALVRRQPNAPQLVLAGATDGSALPPLGGDDRNLAQRRVSFLGYVSNEQRLRLYHEASMLVMASEDEGFGMPALEAMTVGLPVVAVHRGSLPEVVGDAGILVDPEDPDALTGAMERLLLDAALRRQLAAAGTARARRFSWDTSADRLLQAFRDGLARRRPRG